eukprot:5993864-Pleurochrysis_carterae.AAC.2
MRPISLCAFATNSNSAGKRMRQWDFVAAYLKAMKSFIVTLLPVTSRLAPMGACASAESTSPCKMAWRKLGADCNARSANDYSSLV